MNAIPTEGLFEAYLELRAQMNDAARARNNRHGARNKHELKQYEQIGQ